MMAARYRPGAAIAMLIASSMMLGCGSALETLNAVTPGSAYERSVGITYGSEARQRMDVYRAVNRAEDALTIVFVYGGAWRQGKRADYAFVAQALAAAGHDVMIPDYRLYPQVTWPLFVEDVALALRELHDNADTLLGRSLNDVVLMGHSSGAHTAAVLASNADHWMGDGPRPAVTGLIGIAGPYDLPLEDPEVAPVFANIEDPTLARPPASVAGNHPPTLLIHGRDDKRVLPMHSERYQRALAEQGIPVALHLLDDEGHASAIAGMASPLDAVNDVEEIVTSWLAARQ